MEETGLPNENWDVVIEPSSSLFNLGLIDVWRYRDLLYLLVRRDFVSFYKQTILGPLWFFIQPLFTAITFNFIFGKLASISTDDIPGPLFYMAGIVPWNYFSDCMIKTSTVFKDNAAIFGKVYFPRLIMPLSIIFSNLVRLIVQLLMFIILLIYYKLNFNIDTNLLWGVFILPVCLVIMASLGLGLGMIISAMTTKYRDLAFLISFAAQLFMYVTPVIYPISSVPLKYQSLILLNPMASLIESVRFVFVGKGLFSLELISYSGLTAGIILIIGVIVFNKVEKRFVDTV